MFTTMIPYFPFSINEDFVFRCTVGAHQGDSDESLDSYSE
jgi:hypothetical protein